MIPWVEDVLGCWEAPRRRVVDHEAWGRMRDGSLDPHAQRNLFVGFWPLIERFPQFIALNLLKTSYGSDPALNAARGWLAANVRIEHRHAEWFLDWAEASGVPRDEMLTGPRPAAMTAIADWCWRMCETADLADAMAATNYAIEGATGDWTRPLAKSEGYQRRFAGGDPEKSLRWLRAHAEYDEDHPLEALRIIVRLLGPDPAPGRVHGVREAVLEGYDRYRVALDVALEPDRTGSF